MTPMHCTMPHAAVFSGVHVHLRNPFRDKASRRKRRLAGWLGCAYVGHGASSTDKHRGGEMRNDATTS